MDLSEARKSDPNGAGTVFCHTENLVARMWSQPRRLRDIDLGGSALLTTQFGEAGPASCVGHSPTGKPRTPGITCIYRYQKRVREHALAWLCFADGDLLKVRQGKVYAAPTAEAFWKDRLQIYAYASSVSGLE